MATPCTNNPNEVIEKVISAKANADKFDKFVNGTDMQTVQLGSGPATPVIRNVVRQVMADAAWAKAYVADAPEGDVSLNNVTALGSTTSRTLADRFADVVNVEDFGAKGDGVTDDTAAIQAALDAAALAGIGRVLAEGVFGIAGTLELPSNVFFGGNSRTKCNLQLYGASKIIAKNASIETSYARNVELRAVITATDSWTGVSPLELAGIEYSFFDVELTAPAGTDAIGVLITTIEINGAYRKGRNNRFDNIRVSNFSTGIKITKASGDTSTDGSTFNTFIHGHISGFKKGVYVEYGEASTFVDVRCTTNIPGSSSDDVDLKTTCWHIKDSVALLIGCGADFSQTPTPAIPGQFNTWGFPCGRDANTTQGGTNSTIAYRFSPGGGTSVVLSPRGDGCADRVWFDTNAVARTVQVIGYNNPNWISNVSTNYLTAADINSSRVFANRFGKPNPEGAEGSASGAAIAPSSVAVLPVYSDGTNATGQIALGNSSSRWSQLFAATSEISTSDIREKANFADPDEALMKAWDKVDLKSFQFTDAIEKKGENARIHFGVIAQQVAEAFAGEGLDASRYALFCYDKWDDEYGDVEVIDVEAMLDDNGNEVEPAVTHTEKRLVTPAGDRYGIRYSEALALECAYQRWLGEKRDAEIETLKARLATLEQSA